MKNINRKEYYLNKTGEGFPIIFLNSSLLNSDMWNNQIEHFNKKNVVITFDFFGQGRSGTPLTKYTNYESVKDILDFYEINKCIIVGCSFGSSVAIDFALEYPEYIEKLVLITPAINGYNYPLRLMLNSMKNYLTCKKVGIRQGFEQFKKQKYWSYFLPKNKDEINIVKNCFEGNEVFYNTDQSLCTIRKPAAIKEIHKINNKVLIITTEDDSKFNKKVAVLIHRKIPNSRKEILMNTGHLPNIEKSEEVNKLIDIFIHN